MNTNENISINVQSGNSDVNEDGRKRAEIHEDSSTRFALQLSRGQKQKLFIFLHIKKKKYQ